MFNLFLFKLKPYLPFCNATIFSALIALANLNVSAFLFLLSLLRSGFIKIIHIFSFHLCRCRGKENNIRLAILLSEALSALLF